MLLADRKPVFPVSQVSKETSLMFKCHSCSGKFGLIGDLANERKRVIEREKVFLNVSRRIFITIIHLIYKHDQHMFHFLILRNMSLTFVNNN